MGVAEMNRVAEIRNLEAGSLFLEIWSVPVIYPTPSQIIATSTVLVGNFYFTRRFYLKAQCSTRNFPLPRSFNGIAALSEFFYQRFRTFLGVLRRDRKPLLSTVFYTKNQNSARAVPFP